MNVGRHHVRVYSRAGCHLCEEALAVVWQVAGPAHTVDVIDIDTRPEIRDAYTIRVPVVEVDGVEIAEYQLDPGTLRRALA